MKWSNIPDPNPFEKGKQPMNTNEIIFNCGRVKTIMDSIIQDLRREKLTTEKYIRNEHKTTSFSFGLGESGIGIGFDIGPNEDGEDYGSHHITATESPVKKVVVRSITSPVNESILRVDEITSKDKVRFYTNVLIRNPHRRFVATFVKKDNSIRTIVFSPRHEYNDLIGKETTEIGRQIVETKCRRNMINIVEFYRPDDMIDGPECFRPRTINLNTILDLRIAA